MTARMTFCLFSQRQPSRLSDQRTGQHMARTATVGFCTVAPATASSENCNQLTCVQQAVCDRTSAFLASCGRALTHLTRRPRWPVSRLTPAWPARPPARKRPACGACAAHVAKVSIRPWRWPRYRRTISPGRGSDDGAGIQGTSHPHDGIRPQPVLTPHLAGPTRLGRRN
jgi:hypothetical protein